MDVSRKATSIELGPSKSPCSPPTFLLLVIFLILSRGTPGIPKDEEWERGKKTPSLRLVAFDAHLYCPT